LNNATNSDYYKNLKKYMLLFGIWCSHAKPPMHWLFKPFIDKLNTLYIQGASCSKTITDNYCECLLLLTGYYVQPPGMATHVCHGKVLYIVADLPAKAAIRYCSQFNGEHGCTDCEIKGKSVSTGNGHATVFGNQDQKPPLCSHASVSLNAATALQTKQVFWLVLHA
jgi:hypothetical protein